MKRLITMFAMLLVVIAINAQPVILYAKKTQMAYHKDSDESTYGKFIDVDFLVEVNIEGEYARLHNKEKNAYYFKELYRPVQLKEDGDGDIYTTFTYTAIDEQGNKGLFIMSISYEHDIVLIGFMDLWDDTTKWVYCSNNR